MPGVILLPPSTNPLVPSPRIRLELTAADLSSERDPKEASRRLDPCYEEREYGKWIASSLCHYFSPGTDIDETIGSVCDRLHEGESAIVALPGFGLEETIVTLALAIDVAVETKAKAGRAWKASTSRPQEAASTSTGFMSFSTSRSEEAASTSTCFSSSRSPAHFDRPSTEAVTPYVLILVLDTSQAKFAEHWLKQILAPSRLPMQHKCFHDDRLAYTPGNAYDILICESQRLNRLVDTGDVSLAATQMVTWIDPHLSLTSIFRQSLWSKRMADSNILKLASRLKKAKVTTQFVRSGPPHETQSLGAIMAKLLGIRNCTHTMFRVSEDGQLATTVVNCATSRGHGDVTSDQQSSFLRLPGEIRNRIYNLVLEDTPSNFRLTLSSSAQGRRCRAVRESFNDLGRFTGLPERNVFTLAWVSRQLTQETLPLYYAQSVFDFDTVGSMHVFLSGIGENRWYVRHIRILGSKAFAYSKLSTAFKKLRPLLQLKTFTIDVRSLSITEPTVRPGQAPIASFISSIEGFLIRWHEEHKDAEGSHPRDTDLPDMPCGAARPLWSLYAGASVSEWEVQRV